MSATALQSFTAFVRSRLDDHLRLAVAYDSESYEVLHVRDDVAEEYPDQRSQIVQDLLLEGVTEPRQEELFSLGSLAGTVRVFGEGITFHFTRGPHSGVLLSLDPDADPPIASFVRDCRRHLE